VVGRGVALWVRAPRHFIPMRRMEVLFRVFRALGALSEKQAGKTHQVSFGTREFGAIIAARDKITRLLSVDLSRFGIQKPARGPMAELAETGRIPTFDQGAIAKIRSGAIRVIDGNRRPIEAFTENGIRFGDGEEPFDGVVLATGFEPGLEEFLDAPELLGPVRWWKSYPLTDGRSRSSVYPSVFFPGFDTTPLGGHSLGRWGWEVGERIAEGLRWASTAGRGECERCARRGPCRNPEETKERQEAMEVETVGRAAFTDPREASTPAIDFGRRSPQVGAKIAARQAAPGWRDPSARKGEAPMC
jgi:hypothetical protein